MEHFHKDSPSAPMSEVGKLCMCGLDATRDRKRRKLPVDGVLTDKAEVSTCVAFAKKHSRSKKSVASPYARRLHWFSEQLMAGFESCASESPKGSEQKFAEYCLCIVDVSRSKRLEALASGADDIGKQATRKCAVGAGLK